MQQRRPILRPALTPRKLKRPGHAQLLAPEAYLLVTVDDDDLSTTTGILTRHLHVLQLSLGPRILLRSLHKQRKCQGRHTHAKFTSLIWRLRAVGVGGEGEGGAVAVGEGKGGKKIIE